MACLRLPCVSWVVTGKVLPALSIESSRRSSENGAADLTFFFSSVVGGGWAEAAKGFGSQRKHASY